KSMAEDARVSVRNIRRRAKETLEGFSKDGDAGEDEVVRAEKELENITKRYIDETDDALAGKEAERLEVYGFHVTSMTETEATKKKSAGRNLPVAITVGLLLGAAVLASLFIRREAFIVFTIIACALALYEIRVALKKRNIFTPMVPLHVGSIGILVSAYSAGGEALLVSTALTAGGILVWRVLDGGGLTA